MSDSKLYPPRQPLRVNGSLFSSCLFVRSPGIAMALLVLAVLAACDAPPKGPAGTTAQQLATELCTAQAPCTVSVPILSGTQRGQFALEAGRELVLSDRSRVLDANGSPLLVVNTGATNTSLGADVRVGGVVSEAPVTVRAGAVVSGDVRSGSTVAIHKHATVTGSISQNVDLGTPGNLSWSVVYPDSSFGAVTVKSGPTRVLLPGRYGDVAVKSGGNLQLSSGTYFFDSWGVDPQGTVTLDNSAGSIVVYTRAGLTWRGSERFQGANADLLVACVGSEDVVLEAPFHGVVFAPAATLRIGSTTGAFTGGYFGLNVHVRPGVTIRFAPLKLTGPAALLLSASFTPVSGGPAPPALPTDFGQTPEEWASIVAAYVNQLIESGYLGPTIVAPPPSWALASSLTIPTIPTEITRGPGGLLPLDPDAQLAAFAPPDPFAPPPSPNQQGWESGPQSFGNDVFGGSVQLAAHADANQNAQLGFWTHADSILALQLTMFGQDFDALTASATVDTANKKIQPDGTTLPFGNGHVTGCVAIVGCLLDRSFDLTDELHDGLEDQTFSIPLPTIPLPLPPPFTAEIAPAASVAFGAPLDIQISPTAFLADFTPHADAVGSVTVAGGIGAFGLGVTAGIKGSVTLASLQLPLQGGLQWAIDQTPDTPTDTSHCRAVLNGSLTVGAKVSVLKGSLDFVVSVDVFFFSADIFTQNIAEFPGFDLLNPPPLELANFNAVSFDLDSSQCALGAATCATVATPNEAVVNGFDFDTGFSGAIGARYGQAACEDQFLVDVDLTQALAGKDFFVAGIWTASIPNQLPCDEQATMTVFVFDGTSWSTFDQVQTTAIAQGNVCGTVQSHSNSSQDPAAGGTLIKATDGFQRVRIAVNATEAGVKVPVAVFGHAL